MKMFVWQNIDQATENYHSEGGVVVIAESEAEARVLANSIEGCRIKEDETPDHIRDGVEGPASIFIFPDAGCC